MALSGRVREGRKESDDSWGEGQLRRPMPASNVKNLALPDVRRTACRFLEGCTLSCVFSKTCSRRASIYRGPAQFAWNTYIRSSPLFCITYLRMDIPHTYVFHFMLQQRYILLSTDQGDYVTNQRLGRQLATSLAKYLSLAKKIAAVQELRPYVRTRNLSKRFHPALLFYPFETQALGP